MKIRTISFVLLISTPSLWAKDFVTLQSSDGQRFKVEREVAEKSQTIKDLIHDLGGVETVIPLSNINDKTLDHVIVLLRALVSDPNRAIGIYMNKAKNKTRIPTRELKQVIEAINFLDVKHKHPNDVLSAALKVYGDRIFGEAELAKLRTLKTSESYATYRKQNLSLLPELQKIVVRQSLQSIDRIFLDKSPDRRLNAIKQTPLDVAQVIAYIAEYQTPSADKLPRTMRKILETWQGKDYPKKIHFGPWPTEFASWPSHCPLQSNPNYNMYSDGTPNDRYIDNADGSVTDVCTKLTWEQAPPILESLLQETKDRCAKMNNQEVKNWRLPTRIELQMLVNYEAAAPALNSIFKKGNEAFWSSTPQVVGKPTAWLIHFGSGIVTSGAAGRSHRVRCVRGETGGLKSVGAQSHYSYHNDDETVVDNFTGAVWQRQANEERNCANALEYCANFNQDGTGWLLPTVKQLSTLVDPGEDGPKIDKAAFPQTSIKSFCSRTAFVGEHGRVWGVSFFSGWVDGSLVSMDLPVRCVR